jgi:hypothetical protein
MTRGKRNMPLEPKLVTHFQDSLPLELLTNPHGQKFVTLFQKTMHHFQRFGRR